ncbi:MAG: HDIG domain-containing protein [Proteobacteria bacterium]|nr:HDIG domain-containing protein [Pseudomonadota bacterium]
MSLSIQTQVPSRAAPNPTARVEDMEALLQKHCPLSEPAFSVLLAHSRAVAALAARLARQEGLSDAGAALVEEAALVHDIGIFATRAPSLGCHGAEPYYRHGVLGAKILATEGLPEHARVCERHVGTGISRRESRSRGLDLPDRDLVPVTLPEILVCFADKFFSKNNGETPNMKTEEEILISLAPFGPGQVENMKAWLARFGDPGRNKTSTDT